MATTAVYRPRCTSRERLELLLSPGSFSRSRSLRFVSAAAAAPTISYHRPARLVPLRSRDQRAAPPGIRVRRPRGIADKRVMLARDYPSPRPQFGGHQRTARPPRRRPAPRRGPRASPAVWNAAAVSASRSVNDRLSGADGVDLGDSDGELGARGASPSLRSWEAQSSGDCARCSLRGSSAACWRC